MGLGEWNKRDSTGQLFKWVNQTAYLGVFVGKDMLQAMKDIWQKVTRKLKTAVNLWKARTLSLRGKAVVINTCMVSRTVYTASVFPMPTETLTKINKVIWPFLWDNSPDLVSREQATRPLSEGGLGIVDIPDKVRSIGMRASELSRATAVEYHRLKEKPCWVVLAEQRLEAGHTDAKSRDSASDVARFHSNLRIRRCKIAKNRSTSHRPTSCDFHRLILHQAILVWFFERLRIGYAWQCQNCPLAWSWWLVLCFDDSSTPCFVVSTRGWTPLFFFFASIKTQSTKSRKVPWRVFSKRQSGPTSSRIPDRSNVNFDRSRMVLRQECFGNHYLSEFRKQTGRQ